MPSGRQPLVFRDKQLWAAFVEKPAPPGMKNSIVSCRFCTKHQNQAEKPWRMRQHLETCQGYLDHPAHATDKIVLAVKNQRKEVKGEATVFSSYLSTDSLVQTRLTPLKLTDIEKDILNELAALAIYVGGKPLNFYDEFYLRAFMNRLNPSYNLPSRRAFSEELLDSAYEKMKSLVLQTIDDAYFLNLVTDGSSNINHARLINISLHTPMGALYLESIETDILKHGGEEIANHVNTRIRAWCGNDLKRINSIATDTENTMRSFITALHQKPE